MRVFNFSAGPAVLPVPVLEQARDEMLEWQGIGMSVMEVSHRGKAFVSMVAQAETDLRSLMGIPTGYRVLFLQGGATGQFTAVPMNLASSGAVVDYLDTGIWSGKAIAEARRFCTVNTVAEESASGYTTVPRADSLRFTPAAAYAHYTPNETIGGVEFPYVPDTGGIPLVADLSSTILSRPLDVSRFGLLYAGAQKNIGPAGLVIVIVRDDLIGNARSGTPPIWDYALMAKEGSMLNTPPTFGLYIAGLVFRWLKGEGGLEAIGERNRAKAQLLYDFIDDSGFYRSPVASDCRSWMNVPFRVFDAALERSFCALAAAEGLVNLEGHRLQGGMRASLYNAMPVAGVEALVAFMREFPRLRSRLLLFQGLALHLAPLCVPCLPLRLARREARFCLGVTQLLLLRLSLELILQPQPPSIGGHVAPKLILLDPLSVGVDLAFRAKISFLLDCLVLRRMGLFLLFLSHPHPLPLLLCLEEYLLALLRLLLNLQVVIIDLLFQPLLGEIAPALRLDGLLQKALRLRKIHLLVMLAHLPPSLPLGSRLRCKPSLLLLFPLVVGGLLGDLLPLLVHCVGVCGGLLDRRERLIYSRSKHVKRVPWLGARSRCILRLGGSAGRHDDGTERRWRRATDILDPRLLELSELPSLLLLLLLLLDLAPHTLKVLALLDQCGRRARGSFLLRREQHGHQAQFFRGRELRELRGRWVMWRRVDVRGAKRPAGHDSFRGAEGSKSQTLRRKATYSGRRPAARAYKSALP